MAEYKNLDRTYVAKQLNGPVITAFIKAVYNFLHKDVDDHSAYFRNLSIDTANVDHLVFIGKLMGLQLFKVFSDQGGNKYLTFTLDNFDSSEYSYDNGWQDVYMSEDDGATGVFGTGNERLYPVVLSTEQYASILKALGETKSGNVDTLVVVDTITYNFLQSTQYNISYGQDVDTLRITVDRSVNAMLIDILQNVFSKLMLGGISVEVVRS